MQRALRNTSLALALLVAFVPRGAAACSISTFMLGRAPEATYFTAVATADTVRAGAGPAASALPLVQQDSIRAGNWQVFGQVVDIDQIAGPAAPVVRRAHARGIEKAVVVPWGYAADCQAIIWSHSAQWVMPGTTNFFRSAHLRPRADWVRGMPTFDVKAAYERPYPYGGRHIRLHLLYETGVVEHLRDSVRAQLPAPVRDSLRAMQQFFDSLRTVLDSSEAALLNAMADTISTPRPDSLSPGTSDSARRIAWETWFSAEQAARRRAQHAHAADTARLNRLREHMTELRRPIHRRARAARAHIALPMDSLLSAQEYFSLYEAMPYYTGEAPGALSSLEPLWRWEAEHPEAAKRYPATWILSAARRHARRERE